MIRRSSSRSVLPRSSRLRLTNSAVRLHSTEREQRHAPHCENSAQCVKTCRLEVVIIHHETAAPSSDIVESEPERLGGVLKLEEIALYERLAAFSCLVLLPDPLGREDCTDRSDARTDQAARRLTSQVGIRVLLSTDPPQLPDVVGSSHERASSAIEPPRKAAIRLALSALERRVIRTRYPNQRRGL